MPIRVYLADDHTIVRDGLRALLEARPEILVVGDAATGRAAVAGIRALRPDIVLMDVSMPDLDGIEATEQLQTVASRTRVIILSMYGTPALVSRALKAGARGYLLKESAGCEVVNAIFAVYAGQMYFSQPVMTTVITEFVRLPASTNGLCPLDSLSAQEHNVLDLVLEGLSSAEIGESLRLSPKTVDSYRSRLMHKLGTSNLVELIKFGIQNGIVSLD